MLNWLQSLFGPKNPPRFTPNTFILWEPCTHSHGEVVPGFTKYLLDLGYEVAVFITPKRYDEGLFNRFCDINLTLHRLSQRQIRRFFKKSSIGDAKGILVTTARKISGRADYSAEKALFENRTTSQSLLLVEHDVQRAYDSGHLTPETITLRAPQYKNAITTVVNPHYFGQVQITQKNTNNTTFITIGALRKKRRNTEALVNAVSHLHINGITNFRVCVIGRGTLNRIPKELRPYFEIKGRLDFSQLYTEVENADYFLTLLDPDNPKHDRYITTGTSGNYQLIYGFAKPCLIAEKFATINQFNDSNSIIYSNNDTLATAMAHAVSLPAERYKQLQESLISTADSIYKKSLDNLRGLIKS